MKKKYFICEICHCKTPIACEGSEPNTCADCMPIRDDFPTMARNVNMIVMCDILGELMKDGNNNATD